MNLLRPRSLLRPVRSEVDGGPAGFHREHWDDHVDATVLARTMKLRTGLLPIAGGAWTASGIYLLNFIDAFDATQLAIDLSLATHKWAMYNNTEAPNYSTETAYAATNEVTGTGYTAGGQVIVSPTLTESPAGTVMYDMADEVWASPTSVTAYGAKLYADALVGNNLIVGMNFGGAFTSTAGTFTIQFNSLGVATWDLTP